MALTRPFSRLLALSVVLAALLAIDAGSAPVAPAAPHRAKGAAALGNAVSLTPSRAKPRPRRAPAQTSAQPSDLLFNGSRIADFKELQAAPGAITEAPDPAGSGETAIQMSVDENDVFPVTPTDNPRAQALSPDVIQPGGEIWLSTKFMLPQDFPSSVPGWMSLVAIYGAPFKGSGPWEIGISGDEVSWQRNATYDYDVPWSMPLVKGRWVSILLHERFASDGWVEMWVDGQPVSFPGAGQRLSMQTMDSSNNGGANAAKIMQYREAGMFDSASVYFGALKVGTTRTSVGA